MRRLLLAAALAATSLLLLAPTAFGAFGFKSVDVRFENEDGTRALLAGSHPFQMTTDLSVNTIPTASGTIPEGEIQNLDIAQIEGFIGNQTAVPTCEPADFNTRKEGRPNCPNSTVVGYSAVEANFEEIKTSEAGLLLHVAVYNLTPPPGVPARLGFVVLNVPVTVDVSLTTSEPYRLVARLQNIPQAVLFYRSVVTLWGTPADPKHDKFRGTCLSPDVTVPTKEPVSTGNCPVSLTPKAFLTLPRACEGPLETVFSAISWLKEPAGATALTSDGFGPQGMADCGTLDITPEIEAQPSTAQAESPAGLDFSLDVEDQGLVNPSGRAKSDIRKVIATLPPGVTANPSAAEGLGVCTTAQYEAASLTATGCPENSKLGTVKVQSPIVAEPIEGSLYLAEQDKNPFGSFIALYIILRSDKYGVVLKQAGKVEPDPNTGQLVSTFEDIPQVPFARFTLSFREGPRAPLVTPPTCGAYTVSAQFTPWSNAAAQVPAKSEFKVSAGPNGGACPAGGVPPFAPGFEAGALNNNGGAYSPFYMRLTRKDGEQNMTRFDAVLPKGVVGKIAGVAKCADAALEAAKLKSGRAELAAPSCPASSRIGRVVVGAGVGPALTYVPGTIYLAGPFGGAPLSIAVITPAVAGPFDVGTVLTRVALNLDPSSAEVTVDGAASDPIPHILKGIPLKLRDLRIYVDRENFTLNATSCDPKQVNATVFGSGADLFSAADNVPVALKDRYQAANCSRLPFKPKLVINLKGGTKRNDHPSLRSTLTARPGDANIGRAVITLPPSENIDNAHINNPCTRVQFNANQCPKTSILGTAKASTPLLDEPLEGNVYFRSNGGERLLPDIVADLKGQFRIILIGAVDAKNGRIRTTFAGVPDAPVKKFQLNLFGGKRGLLVNNRNLCKGKLRSNFRFIAQNNKVAETNPVLGTSCKKSKGAKGSKRR